MYQLNTTLNWMKFESYLEIFMYKIVKYILEPPPPPLY